MKYTVTINNKVYEVEVERGQANIIKTSTVTTPVVPAPAPAAPAPAAAPVSGGKVVSAPMPGTILDIKVAPGKSVKKGEILLILEAMKMENEIFAPEDGVIAQVITTKGAAVATGDALIVMQ